MKRVTDKNHTADFFFVRMAVDIVAVVDTDELFQEKEKQDSCQDGPEDWFYRKVFNTLRNKSQECASEQSSRRKRDEDIDEFLLRFSATE